ncbi:MAG: J domain-containing protein [Thermoanaerobaculia bacterium]
MTRDEAFRLLELSPGASEDEIRAAWRDLSKVWHPDRFASDPAMQRKAEEKLKGINEAYDALQRSEGARRSAPPPPPPPPSARPADPAAASRRRAVWAIGLAALAAVILLRRPTPGGLLVAGILVALAFAVALRR